MGLGAWIWEIDRGRPLGMSTESLELWREDREERDSLSLEECEELLLLLEEDLCEDDLCEEEDDLDEDFDEEEEDDFEEDLEDEERDEDLWESVGTSRTFSSRPVVGSTVEETLGLWATW
jgi:hypothetical protein